MAREQMLMPKNQRGSRNTTVNRDYILPTRLLGLLSCNDKLQTWSCEYSNEGVAETSFDYMFAMKGIFNRGVLTADAIHTL